MSSKQKQKRLSLTADQLVRLVITQLDATNDELAFKERDTLLLFAVDLAERFRASTAIHNELAARCLGSEGMTAGGRRYVLLLAPRVSRTMQEEIFSTMLHDFMRVKHADTVISYAQVVLKRELTLPECETMKQWYKSCSNASEQAEREAFLEYINVTFPKEFKKFVQYFEGEDFFWAGPGRFL
jgi:hypothetical protein